MFPGDQPKELGNLTTVPICCESLSQTQRAAHNSADSRNRCQVMNRQGRLGILLTNSYFCVVAVSSLWKYRLATELSTLKRTAAVQDKYRVRQMKAAKCRSSSYRGTNSC